ncbi:MAG: hypothetical protein O2819_09040 [Planctomycetota bacterium]|nr:hypothetical protein [Planctomycetota bacterium]
MTAAAASVAHPGDPLLPDAQMHLVLPNAPVAARVVHSEVSTCGKSQSIVRHVCIDVSGTPLAGHFLAGQSFGVIPPGVDAHGRAHKVRLYSIASPAYGEDGAGCVLSATVKRLVTENKTPVDDDSARAHPLFLGVASNFLCDLGPGAEVMVSGPSGKRFVLPVHRDDHDYLFFATGTGIAPFRGMLHELLVGPPEWSPARAGWKPCASTITLVMGSPYTTDLLYDRWLRELASAHANFDYRTCISREPAAAAGGRYVHDHIAKRMDDFREALSSPRTLMYVCGLAGMQVGLFRVLAGHGLGERWITVDAPLAGTDPATWADADIKRRVRHTRRCMLEVY